MPASIRGVVDLARREAGEAAGGLATRAVLAGVAALLALASVGFFLASITSALSDVYGRVAATAIVGAALLAVAVALLLAARLRARRQAVTLARLRQRRETAMRSLAVESALGGLLSFAGFGSRDRGAIVPVAAGIALGWFAERRLRRGRP